MLLGDFISSYGVSYGDFFSIDGFCEVWSKRWIMDAEWYDSIKGRSINIWQAICSGYHPIEIYVELEPD